MSNALKAVYVTVLTLIRKRSLAPVFELHYFTFERIKTKLKLSPAEVRREWIARQSELFTQIRSDPTVMSLPHTPSRLYEPEEQPLLLIE